MRLSMAFVRWAVVRDVSPPPIVPASSTMTDFPSRARRYAVVSPAIPAPTTHTSATASLSSGAAAGIGVVIHGDTDWPDGMVMSAIPQRVNCETCGAAKRLSLRVTPLFGFGVDLLVFLTIIVQIVVFVLVRTRHRIRNDVRVAH